MCRNIRPLFNFEPPATDDEIRAASVQFVRKISGYTRPSLANEAAFNRAVEDVASASRRLLASLVTSAGPRDRETEAERLRERSRLRFSPRPRRRGTLTARRHRPAPPPRTDGATDRRHRPARDRRTTG